MIYIILTSIGIPNITISRFNHLFNGNPFTGKKVFLYRIGPQIMQLQPHNQEQHYQHEDQLNYLQCGAIIMRSIFPKSSQ